MKYRSRTDIVHLILEAANGGAATKSKIMYKEMLLRVMDKCNMCIRGVAACLKSSIPSLTISQS